MFCFFSFNVLVYKYTRSGDILRSNKELLKELKEYEIKYKDNLDLPKNVLFGLEIEYEGLKQIKFTLPNSWINKEEDTIPDGGEINSNPMVDSLDTWNNLKYVLETLKEEGAKIYDAASGHIHFDSRILGSDFDAWIRLIKLWIMYEPIIYRFSSGEKDKLRKLCMKYAFYLRYSLLDKYDRLMCCTDYDELISCLNNVCTRCYGLCLSNVDRHKDKNTIEVRCPNGSLEPIIWQNNVDFFANFFLAIKNKEIDEELFKYRTKTFDEKIRYGKTYLNEDVNLAIELSDFIFCDEEKKMDFLKQYTKTFKNKNDIFYRR